MNRLQMLKDAHKTVKRIAAIELKLANEENEESSLSFSNISIWVESEKAPRLSVEY